MTRVLYLYPPAGAINGVRAYAHTICEAFRRYGSGQYLLQDAMQLLYAVGLHPHASLAELQTTAKERLYPLLRDTDDVMIYTEIGLSDHLCFHTAMLLKQAFPAIPSLVCLHDPPGTAVNLNPIFLPYQHLLPVRAVRRLYNRLLGTRCEERFFRQGHTLLVLSEQGRSALRQRLNALGLPPATIHLVPHLNYLDECDRPAAPLSHHTGLKLGFLGIIAHSKGLDTLVTALQQLKSDLLPISLELVGDAPGLPEQHYRDQLAKRIRAAGLDQQVTLRGPLPDRELPGFLAGIDLLVLPYLATGSGSSSGPLMWARSMGIPVLASATRNMPEMIRHGHDGLLVTPGSATELADRLRELTGDRSLFLRLRHGAQQRTHECSWPITVQRLEALMQSVTAPDRKDLP